MEECDDDVERGQNCFWAGCSGSDGETFTPDEKSPLVLVGSLIRLELVDLDTCAS